MGVSWALLLLLALWGFAEATLFFVVPDVAISAVAVALGRKAGLVAAGAAVTGALVGGAAMVVWGLDDAAAALGLIERLPAISPTMIEGVKADLAADGLLAVVLGGITGVPLKIYAVAAPEAGFGLAEFLAATALARIIRFAAAALIADAVARGLLGRFTVVTRLTVLAGLWAVFYAAYWWLMPG